MRLVCYGVSPCDFKAYSILYACACVCICVYGCHMNCHLLYENPQFLCLFPFCLLLFFLMFSDLSSPCLFLSSSSLFPLSSYFFYLISSLPLSSPVFLSPPPPLLYLLMSSWLSSFPSSLLFTCPLLFFPLSSARLLYSFLFLPLLDSSLAYFILSSPPF